MSRIKENYSIKGRMIFTIRDAKTGKIKRRYKYDNLIVTVGRSVLAQKLASDDTYTGHVDYGALGTGTNAPANADTQLQTEVYRKAVSSYTSNNNIAYISFFYNATETTGTYREFGTFIDGTAVADSGQLFTRVAINVTKTNTESLTLDCEYDIT